VWSGDSSGAEVSLDFVIGLKANINTISSPILNNADDSSGDISKKFSVENSNKNTETHRSLHSGPWPTPK